MSILPSLARSSTSSSRCLVRLVATPSRNLHLLNSPRSSFQPPSSSSSSSFPRAQRHASSRRPRTDDVEESSRPPHLDLLEEDERTTSEPDSKALPPPLSPEEEQIRDLKELRESLGRNLKGNEIPHDLVVRPFLPEDPRPRPPILFSAVHQLPEFRALLPTHTPVLLRISLGTPENPDSYPLLRVLETQALIQMEIEQVNKAKEVARVLALQNKPGALGAHSGLRNQAQSKDFQGTWVMAENDLNHRVKQIRDRLLNSEKISLEMKPKKYGKKVKVTEEKKQETLERIEGMLKDIAEKCQEDKVLGEGVTLYFQPIKSVRDAVVKAEKLKMEEKAKKETLERAKKEKKAASLPGKAPKWKPGQPIPTAAALGSTPPTNYQ